MSVSAHLTLMQSTLDALIGVTCYLGRKVYKDAATFEAAMDNIPADTAEGLLFIYPMERGSIPVWLQGGSALIVEGIFSTRQDKWSDATLLAYYDLLDLICKTAQDRTVFAASTPDAMGYDVILPQDEIDGIVDVRFTFNYKKSLC